MKFSALAVLIGFFFLLPFQVQAQSSFYLIGRVATANGEALVGASIQFKVHGTGTVSDGNGRFLLSVPQVPDTLEVRYLGFESQSKAITAGLFARSDTIQFKFQLSLKTEILGTVEVLESSGYAFYHPKSVSVIDYVFTNSGVMILQKRRSKQELVLVDYQGQLLDARVLTSSIQELRQDCLGNNFLAGRDSVQTTSVYGQSIVLDKLWAKKDFDELVKPCVASNNKNLYFQFGDHFQLVFTQANHQSENAKPLYVVADRENNLSLMEYLNDANIAAAQGQAKKAYEMRMWYKKILTNGLTGYIMATDSGAVILDLTTDSAFYFSMDGKYLSTAPAEFLSDKSFTGTVLKDDLTGYHYLLFERAGVVGLQQSEPGIHLVPFYSLSQTSFPRKLGIRGGDIYFLQYDEGDMDRTKLFRVNGGRNN